MSRYTSEDAVAQVGSRYDLILIGARRARELLKGWHPQIKTQNGAVVTAIAEIEAGKIGREYLLKQPNLARGEKPPEDK